MHLENAHPNCVCFDNRKKKKKTPEKRKAPVVYMEQCLHAHLCY